MNIPPRKMHAIGAILGPAIASYLWWISTIPTSDPAAAKWCFWFGVIAGVMAVLTVLDAQSAWKVGKDERRERAGIVEAAEKL